MAGVGAAAVAGKAGPLGSLRPVGPVGTARVGSFAIRGEHAHMLLIGGGHMHRSLRGSVLHAHIPAPRFSEQKQALDDALNQSLVLPEVAVNQRMDTAFELVDLAWKEAS
jgi:hypothetical protein